MKLLTTTALAALLGASPAMVASQDSGDSNASDSSQSGASSSDMSDSTDMSAGADEMYDGDDTASDSGSSDTDNLVRVRDITGGPIYTMNLIGDDDWDVMMAEESIGADWTEIGEIEDLVLSRTGQLTGIVAEVGGFLDIGDKHVLLPINDVKLVPSEDRTYSIVTRFSEEDLSELENIDESPWY